MSVQFNQLGNQGRLGNALFQISATIALANRNKVPFYFNKWEYSSIFNIPQAFFKDNLPTPSYTYQEPYYHYSNIPYTRDMNLSGYFQSYKYWSDCNRYVKSCLTPKISFGKIYDTMFIHIRQKDYVNQPQNYINLLNTNYYKDAMLISQAKKYMIFSDDIEICKKHFIGDQFNFSENHSEIEDLSLMVACELGGIVANSSFSWWGAYLNNQPKKVIISPKMWFGPSMPHNTDDLIPQNWLKL